MTFEETWERHTKYIYNLVRQRADSDQDTQEILGIVTERAFKDYGALRNKSTFKSWIWKIAYRSVSDYYKNKDDSILIEPALLDAYIKEFERFEAAADNRIVIQDFISGLPVRWQDALYMNLYQEMNAREISDIMGAEYAAMKKQLNRLKRKLRELLRAET